MKEHNRAEAADTGKIPRKKRKVGVVQRSASRKKDLRNGKPSHSKKYVTPSLLQDELGEDKSLMEIEKKSGDVTNPFAFK